MKTFLTILLLSVAVFTQANNRITSPCPNSLTSARAGFDTEGNFSVIPCAGKVSLEFGKDTLLPNPNSSFPTFLNADYLHGIGSNSQVVTNSNYSGDIVNFDPLVSNLNGGDFIIGRSTNIRFNGTVSGSNSFFGS